MTKIPDGLKDCGSKQNSLHRKAVKKQQELSNPPV